MYRVDVQSTGYFWNVYDASFHDMIVLRSPSSTKDDTESPC